MRHYKLKELAARSGISARTIGDYVAKGLLSGPSHRGRGAVYPRCDLDALRVIPKLRTLMPAVFSNLPVIAQFLAVRSSAELHGLVNLTDESEFLSAVHRIRLSVQLQAMLPAVAPERITACLATLTSAQLLAMDRGELLVGAVVDLAALSEMQEPRADTQEAIAGTKIAGTGRQPPHDAQLTGAGVEIQIEESAFGRANNKSEIVAAVRAFADQLERLIQGAPDSAQLHAKQLHQSQRLMEGSVGAGV